MSFPGSVHQIAEQLYKREHIVRLFSHDLGHGKSSGKIFSMARIKVRVQDSSQKCQFTSSPCCSRKLNLQVLLHIVRHEQYCHGLFY